MHVFDPVWISVSLTLLASAGWRLNIFTQAAHQIQNSVIIFQALHGQSTVYISELLQVAGHWSSLNKTYLLYLPWPKTKWLHLWGRNSQILKVTPARSLACLCLIFPFLHWVCGLCVHVILLYYFLYSYCTIFRPVSIGITSMLDNSAPYDLLPMLMFNAGSCVPFMDNGGK